jgi:hypothetical protein
VVRTLKKAHAVLTARNTFAPQTLHHFLLSSEQANQSILGNEPIDRLVDCDPLKTMTAQRS